MGAPLSAASPRRTEDKDSFLVSDYFPFFSVNKNFCSEE